mgnify:CR=1 FL=1
MSEWKITKIKFIEESIGSGEYQIGKVTPTIIDSDVSFPVPQSPYYWDDSSNPLFSLTLDSAQADSFMTHSQEYLFETLLNVTAGGDKPDWMTQAELVMNNTVAPKRSTLFSVPLDSDSIVF